RDCSDLVVDGDPALPLMTVAEASAEAELEQRQLFLQRTTLGGQHDSGAQVDCADACFLRRQRGCFPLLAQVAEKIAARCRQLVEPLVAAISVPADRRTGQENRGHATE